MANSTAPAQSIQSTTTNSVQQQAKQSVYLLPSLITIYNKTLSTTLAKCSYPAFAACFPTPAAKKPDILKTVWKQIVDKTERKALTEFEAICRERELDRRFAELEVVLKDAKENMENSEEKDRANVAFHSLPPSDLFLATLAPQLEPIIQRLDQNITHQQQTNDHLIKELLEKKNEIESIVKKLESVVSDIRDANEVLYKAGQDMAENKED